MFFSNKYGFLAQTEQFLLYYIQFWYLKYLVKGEGDLRSCFVSLWQAYYIGFESATTSYLACMFVDIRCYWSMRLPLKLLAWILSSFFIVGYKRKKVCLPILPTISPLNTMSVYLTGNLQLLVHKNQNCLLFV